MDVYFSYPMKFIIRLIVIVLLLVTILSSGCIELEKTFDHCKYDFEECKYSCGDGWLSGLCKADCSDRYNNCKKR